MDTQNPDAGLGVEFFTKSVENNAKSLEAGRPIFEEKEYVRIRFPGDNKRELCAPAHEMHFNGNVGVRQQMTYAQRFPASYEAFKQERTDFIAGTPLIALVGLSGAERAELEAMRIHTVEQLASLATPARKKLGVAGNKMIPMAEDYLKGAGERSEIAALKAEIAAMKAKQEPVQADQFAGFTDDDLKNMIRDAGGEVPKGNARRETLIKRLTEMAEAKEDA